MIVQNTGNVSQAPQPDVYASNNTAPRVATGTPAQATPQFSPQQLHKAVESINKALQQANTNLELSVDPDTKIPVVKMVDTATGELIRQYPSKETLAIARSIDEYQHGLLLRQKA